MLTVMHIELYFSFMSTKEAADLVCNSNFFNKKGLL